MVFSDYTELRDAIKNWTERGGQADFTNRIPEFIAFAEHRFNYGEAGQFPTDPIRVREMEATTDLSPTNGVYTLPADFLEARRVTALTRPRRTLEMQAAGQIDWRYPHRESGYPNHYSIEGDQLIVLPKAASDVELLYYQKIPALESVSTNWLLTDHPSLYLYASLVQAYLWSQEVQKAQVFAHQMAAALDGLEHSDRSARWVGGPVYARQVTP